MAEVSNNVPNLASASNASKNSKVFKQDDKRKQEFESLRNAMASNAPGMGRDIILSQEMYDSNILKGDQESKSKPKKSSSN